MNTQPTQPDKRGRYAALDELNRELRFFPADAAKAKTMTKAQAEHFNANGIVHPFTIYDETEAAENCKYFDWMIAEVEKANDGRNAYSINGYQAKCQKLYDMVVDPRILDLVEDILGPNIVCWGTHFFCKMPGDPKLVAWHQDASYWPLSPSKTVTVWLAIDDADAGNAAMKVIPGTHNVGQVEFEETNEEDQVLNQKIINAERYGDPMYVEMKAGQLSLHADMLVHGSDANMSDRRRCGLTIRYCTADVRGQYYARSIICRGSDPSGHWANIPRPDGEDMSPQK